MKLVGDVLGGVRQRTHLDQDPQARSRSTLPTPSICHPTQIQPPCPIYLLPPPRSRSCIQNESFKPKVEMRYSKLYQGGPRDEMKVGKSMNFAPLRPVVCSPSQCTQSPPLSPSCPVLGHHWFRAFVTVFLEPELSYMCVLDGDVRSC